MKIGIIAPYDVLLSNNGASIRVYELAKNLNANGATVCVLHHGRTKSIGSNFNFIHFNSFNLVSGSSNYLHPLNVTYHHTLYRFLKKFKPDIIQCEQPWSAFSTLFLARIFNIPCILDEHNVEFKWALSASRIPFLAPINYILEKTVCSYSSYILATSDIDKKLLMYTYNISGDKIFIVPNGVDFHRFSLVSNSQSQIKKKLSLHPTKKIVLFHGIMSAKQNYDAANLILDLIAPKFPNEIFLIIGQNSPQWLRNKAKVQENVHFLDYVPNIVEYILASDLCIVPICCGSGTRLKIMEYLAAGKPIVSTTIGAEGIPLKSGKHAILCDGVNLTFVEAMKNILENNELAKELSIASKKLAEKTCWQNVIRPLYDMYLTKSKERATIDN